MVAPDAAVRPALQGLWIGADPEAWRRCGFRVGPDGRFRAGAVVVTIDPDGPPGLHAWALSCPVAGIPQRAAPGPGPESGPHPNGVLGVDHVVVATMSLEDTTRALVDAGCEVRGERHARIGGHEVVQRFLPVTGALIELVSAAGPGEPVAGAAFWGVTFVVADPDAVAAGVGPARDAVQQGRRIAVAEPRAALGTRVAFISPRRG